MPTALDRGAAIVVGRSGLTRRGANAAAGGAALGGVRSVGCSYGMLAADFGLADQRDEFLAVLFHLRAP